MLNNHEINCLGNIINTTWGKSSLNSTDRYSVTCQLKDDVLSLQFQSIVHFASDSSLHEQTRRLANESHDVLGKAMGNLKSKFKEASGTTLSVKEHSNRDDVELISSTVNSPRKVAYYRRRINFFISG